MTQEKDAEPTLESLEPIRQSIRRLCIQDQFTWEQSWKSVLSDVNQVRRGLLLPDVFQQTLELNDVRLTRKALQSIVEQFQLPNGAVQAHKFLQWIDLSKPSDYIDPDLAFARLPQPYRRIVKVLEQDILDVAWEQIRATSARYKAETSAALSARSARSSVLLTHTHEDASALQDDYSAAKKRCCKPSGELKPPASNCKSAVAVKIHSVRPFAVLCWSGDDSDPVLTLELINIQFRSSVISIAIDVPGGTPAATTTEASIKKTLQVVQMSDLRSRPQTASDSSADNDKDRLVVAIHVRETVPTTDAAVTVDHLLVYEFTVSTPTKDSTACLLTSLTFSDPNEVIVALTLSQEVSLLAVATTKCELSVFSIPPPPKQTGAVETESSTPTQTRLPTTLALVTKFSTDALATAVHFLYPPIVDTPTRPSPSSVALPPYALAVAAAKCLTKYRLPPANSEGSTAASVVAKWPHLQPITSCTIDSTSQFITVGLADGFVVVWDLLANRDHVILTPPSLSSPLTSVGAAVDLAFLCGGQFVAVLLLGSQRLLFYDIADRVAPTLIRVVTPPQPTSNSTVASAATADPIRFVFLSPLSPLLDVPIAMVAYSNGYVMLYDVRNSEAMASVRVSKDGLVHPRTCTVDIAPANSAVIALTPSPVVFDWGDLLTTAFPSLLSVLRSKNREQTSDNLKREFIASVDLSTSSPFSDGATLSIGAKASLHSMLLASVGHTDASTGKSSIADLLSSSKSSSSLPQTVSNSDSRTSLATTASGMVTPATSQERDVQANLLDCAPYPYKPTIGALFERFRDEELKAAAGSSADAKLHRRRNELLKILTAAW